jgi:hypothetical protein
MKKIVIATTKPEQNDGIMMTYLPEEDSVETSGWFDGNCNLDGFRLDRKKLIDILQNLKP